VREERRRGGIANERAAGIADAFTPPALRNSGHYQCRRPHRGKEGIGRRIGEDGVCSYVDDPLDGQRRIGEKAARVSLAAARFSLGADEAKWKATRRCERGAQLERRPIVLAAAEWHEHPIPSR
jgi:hypothetical protein